MSSDISLALFSVYGFNDKVMLSSIKFNRYKTGCKPQNYSIVQSCGKLCVCVQRSLMAVINCFKKLSRPSMGYVICAEPIVECSIKLKNMLTATEGDPN